MVVNASVADDVLWVFKQLYDAEFPLKKVAFATELSRRASNSSCATVPPSRIWTAAGTSKA
ncbi:MAG: hypothetical protein ACRDHC_09890 [Actinomycetota bacterium]